MNWKPDSGRGGGGGFAAIGRALVRLASSWLVGDDRQGRTVVKGDLGLPESPRPDACFFLPRPSSPDR
jgi:hypothetical protein